ncbi:unnamed protein product [Paramecium primaurelia]|uniref:Transmembrane protein n=1 Tax=Paramecium primaurelia TaxID=5886 RepID=A0A8S1KVW8_PARPR|nr:unnamed protein product [Paramecium primaurelia]
MELQSKIQNFFIQQPTLTNINLYKFFTIQTFEGFLISIWKIMGMKFHNYYCIFLKKMQNVINMLYIFKDRYIFLRKCNLNQKKRLQIIFKWWRGRQYDPSFQDIYHLFNNEKIPFPLQLNKFAEFLIILIFAIQYDPAKFDYIFTQQIFAFCLMGIFPAIIKTISFRQFIQNLIYKQDLYQGNQKHFDNKYLQLKRKVLAQMKKLAKLIIILMYQYLRIKLQKERINKNNFWRQSHFGDSRYIQDCL